MIRQSKANFKFSNPITMWNGFVKHDFMINFLSLKYGVPENVHVRSLEILGGGGSQ